MYNYTSNFIIYHGIFIVNSVYNFNILMRFVFLKNNFKLLRYCYFDVFLYNHIKVTYF